VKHDLAVFADPDAFDIQRPNARQHPAFARGAHFCIGGDARPAARGLVFRKPPAPLVLWG
jgi:hypothetical protein